METVGWLNHGAVVTLYQAAISAGLAALRTGLLSGLPAPFVASLPVVAAPAEQVLADLGTLNGTPMLIDGTVPLVAWLQNAINLSGARQEEQVFRRALDEVLGRADARFEKEVPVNVTNASSSADGVSSVASGRSAAPEPISPTSKEVAREPVELIALLARVSGLRNHLTEQRWSRVAKNAPSTLQEKWSEVVRRMPRDNGAVAPILAAMWKHARAENLVPLVRALAGRVDVDGLAQLYLEKRPWWRCRTTQSWCSIGPRMRASEAEYDWVDNAWERAHPLAGPLFELIWEVSIGQAMEPGRADNVMAHLGLRWWDAGGGTLGDGSTLVFPWPAADLPTFSDYEKITMSWNRAFWRAVEFHEHIPEDEGIADDLAYSYVEAHHVLWHQGAELGWWRDRKDWKGLVEHLFETEGGKDNRDRHAARWTRALPLLAAPESGLSHKAAAAILDGTRLDESLCAELRHLRLNRARLLLGEKSARGKLDALDAKNVAHPWVKHISGRTSYGSDTFGGGDIARPGWSAVTVWRHSPKPLWGIRSTASPWPAPGWLSHELRARTGFRGFGAFSAKRPDPWPNIHWLSAHVRKRR